MHKKNNDSLTKNFIQGLRPLASTLPPKIKKILKRNGFNFSSIVDNWSQIVGKNISDKCYPCNIKAQNSSKSVILILNVMRGKEIDIEYSKKNILDKINSYFGYMFINNIKIKTIEAKYPSSIKKNILNEDKKNAFDNSLKKVEDLNLKNKLKKLVNAYNEKK